MASNWLGIMAAHAPRAYTVLFVLLRRDKVRTLALDQNMNNIVNISLKLYILVSRPVLLCLP
jgi:hypothetical protein